MSCKDGKADASERRRCRIETMPAWIVEISFCSAGDGTLLVYSRCCFTAWVTELSVNHFELTPATSTHLNNGFV